MKQFARKVFHGGVMELSAYDIKGRRKYLTVEEGNAFLKKLDGLSPNEKAFCEFLYYTGCRISESLAISLSDLEVSENIVCIVTLKRREKLVVRRVPIPAHLVEQLSRQKLPSSLGKLWGFSRTSAWRIVKRVMKDARINGIQATAKGLRHGFGVRSALARIPITTIQRWMGHSSLETTAIYLDVRDAEERELMKRTW